MFCLPSTAFGLGILNNTLPTLPFLDVLHRCGGTRTNYTSTSHPRERLHRTHRLDVQGQLNPVQQKRTPFASELFRARKRLRC